MVHVWATGNEGPGAQTVRSPGDRATTIYDSFSVGSTNYNPPFNISYSSSRGPSGSSCGPPENLIKPEVVAPGNNIYSSVPGGGYSNYSGTSMATPHVAGVVALMRAGNPDIDVITIKQILMSSADDLGTPGEDNSYGWGFLDAYEAVTSALTGYGAVAGTLVDDSTGDPIAGARVQVVGRIQSAYTDEYGAFWITLPGGPATLEISYFGYADLSEVLDIPAGGEIQPVLSMVQLPTVTLSGTTYGPGDAPPLGSPTEGVIVQVADTPLAAVTTGADGRYSIDVPMAVEYTLRANLPSEGGVEQKLPAMSDHDCALYLGATVEDGFESGDFSSFPWVFAGTGNWEATTDQAYEGSYSAGSGDIGGSSTGIMYLDIELAEAGPVSFWFKTQAGTGTFSFWDGLVTVQSWSPVSDWTFFSYDAAAGPHTFRWRMSTGSGGGSLFVDNVKFPGGDVPAPRAVPCPGEISFALGVNGSDSAELLVLNQGKEDLIWTLTDAAPYLNIDVYGGTLAPAGYTVVTLDADATGLAEGYHQFNLSLASNDPANPTMIVPVTLSIGGVAAVGGTPSAFAVTGVVPNPFNPQTTIHFNLPRTQTATLRLYDVQGRLIRDLVDGVKQAGPNEVVWNGRDNGGRSVASGTYYARLESGGETSVKSMVLVR